MTWTAETEADPGPDREPFELIAEEYARLCREGTAPSIEEYAARYPAIAEEIRLLLPAVAFLERGKRAGSSPPLGLGSGEMPSLGGPEIRRLGSTRIEREIGRGGMGVVYEAVEEPLGRRVAVKVLPRHVHSDPRSRERFLREARLVAKLQHPHIVPIHSVGEHEDIPYYIMALIDGQGLDRLHDGPAPARPEEPVERARWVADIGCQAASALDYAHAHHVLHRDIKPANLLLDASGKLWLADFGLAKLADDLSLTTTGELPGTLRYLAPECLNSPADERSDIYSLGLTLYELLVDRPAFLELDRIRLLHQIESEDVPPPRRLEPRVPRDLEQVILKATARDPSARYATAAELADDLQRFLDGRPVCARRPSVLGRLVRWSRRNRLVAALTATSIVLAVIAAVFITFWLLAPPHPPGFRPFGPRPRAPFPPGWRPEFGPPPKRAGRPAPPLDALFPPEPPR